MDDRRYYCATRRRDHRSPIGRDADNQPPPPPGGYRLPGGGDSYDHQHDAKGHGSCRFAPEPGFACHESRATCAGAGPRARTGSGAYTTTPGGAAGGRSMTSQWPETSECPTSRRRTPKNPSGQSVRPASRRTSQSSKPKPCSTRKEGNPMPLRGPTP